MMPKSLASALLLVLICSANAQDDIDSPNGVRFATFNASLSRRARGDLISDLHEGRSSQIAAVAEIIQIVRPDVLLINEFDFDEKGEALRLFRKKYLEVSQNGNQPIHYAHYFTAASNTGIPSGLDLDNNGAIDTTPGDSSYANDAFGYGTFEGKFGMALLSRYPILQQQVRTFQYFRWVDMPGALLPPDPNDADHDGDRKHWFNTAEREVVRLSSKSHWDVPLAVDGRIVHAFASHPTPPVFDDGQETDFENPVIVDRNGRRNHDEIRFWNDYISPGKGDYIYDDREFARADNQRPRQPRGGLGPRIQFVILGDQNADPCDGDSTANPMRTVLNNPLVNGSATAVRITPGSNGAVAASSAQGKANSRHKGNPRFDTGDFNDENVGNLRVDYALPSANMKLVGKGVCWPDAEELVNASDHRLVYVDVIPASDGDDR